MNLMNLELFGMHIQSIQLSLNGCELVNGEEAIILYKMLTLIKAFNLYIKPAYLRDRT